MMFRLQALLLLLSFSLFAEEIRGRVVRVADGDTITLLSTSATQHKIRLQRILGTVFVDGRDVNLEMLRAGMAWHYRKYDSSPAYSKAESEAHSAKRGLWQDKSPTEPEQFRKAKRERLPNNFIQASRLMVN